MTGPCRSDNGWPTTRILFALAGVVTVMSAALAASVSPWFLLLTVAVGVNQLVFVATGTCLASFVIERWRQRTSTAV